MAFMGADMQFAGIWRAVQQLCNPCILTSKQLLSVDYDLASLCWKIIHTIDFGYFLYLFKMFGIQLYYKLLSLRSAWAGCSISRPYTRDQTFMLIVLRSNWNWSKKSGKPASNSFENKIKFYWQDDGSPVSLPDTEIRVFNDMLPPPRCEIQIPSLVSLPVVTCPFDSHTPNTGTLSLSLGAGHSFSPASFCINQSHMELRT